jgi:hypothetical protein
MTRRLSVDWPSERRSASTDRPVRILAVSDEVDRALENQANRAGLGTVDLVVGCGDLDPGYLAMLGDAFHAPLVYVRGNHDRGLGWQVHGTLLPERLPDGRSETLAGVRLIGLSWPGRESGRPDHDETAAWRQVLGAGILARFRRGPRLVISHAPPLGAGDDPDDPYHRGFRAYRWLAEWLRPTLWLHGHTTVATSQSLTTQLGPTTIVNVTGSTLIDLVPTTRGAPGARSSPQAGASASPGDALPSPHDEKASTLDPAASPADQPPSPRVPEVGPPAPSSPSAPPPSAPRPAATPASAPDGAGSVSAPRETVGSGGPRSES